MRKGTLNINSSRGEPVVGITEKKINNCEDYIKISIVKSKQHALIDKKNFNKYMEIII